MKISLAVNQESQQQVQSVPWDKTAHEKYSAKKKELFHVSVDLEKALIEFQDKQSDGHYEDN